MKSAIEIAMEKAAKMNGGGEQKLTGEQKTRIGEIRKEYQGKIAEREIMFQSETNRLTAGGNSPEIQQVISESQKEVWREKENLTREMEKKIEALKKGRTAL